MEEAELAVEEKSHADTTDDLLLEQRASAHVGLPVPNGCRHCGSKAMEACGFNEPGQKKVKAEIMANHRAAVLKEKELKDTKKEAEKVKDGKASGAFNFVKPAGIMRRECLEKSNEVGTTVYAMSCVAEFMKLDGCDALRDTGKEGWPFFDWGYEGDVVKEKESKKNKGPHGLFHFLKSGVAKARPCDECADEFKKAGHCRKVKEGEQSLPIEPGCHRCGPQTLAACKVGADTFAEKRGDHVASQEMAKHNLEVKAQKKAGGGGGGWGWGRGWRRRWRRRWRW